MVDFEMQVHDFRGRPICAGSEKDILHTGMFDERRDSERNFLEFGGD